MVRCAELCLLYIVILNMSLQYDNRTSDYISCENEVRQVEHV